LDTLESSIGGHPSRLSPSSSREHRPASKGISIFFLAVLIVAYGFKQICQNTKTNHFLRNVGIQVAKRRTTLQNVQAELEVEKRTNSELQSIVNNQREEMDGLKNQVQGIEQARIKDQEENRKKQAKLEKKIELLLSQNGQS
jgi:hypothetical protein